MSSAIYFNLNQSKILSFVEEFIKNEGTLETHFKTLYGLNPLPNKLLFLDVCSKDLLKTQWDWKRRNCS